MAHTVTNSGKLSKDYFEWIENDNPKYGDKELLNEAAAQVDKFISTYPGGGSPLKDAVVDVLTGHGNNIEDSPWEFHFLMKKLFKIISNPAINKLMVENDLELDKYDINNLSLLQDFFEHLLYQKEAKAEILLHDFRSNPSNHDAEEILKNYKKLTKQFTE